MILQNNKRGPQEKTIIRGAKKKGNRKRGSHAEGQLPYSLYPPHGNRKIKRRLKKNI